MREKGTERIETEVKIEINRRVGRRRGHKESEHRPPEHRRCLTSLGDTNLRRCCTPRSCRDRLVGCSRPSIGHSFVRSFIRPSVRPSFVAICHQLENEEARSLGRPFDRTECCPRRRRRRRRRRRCVTLKICGSEATRERRQSTVRSHQEPVPY